MRGAPVPAAIVTSVAVSVMVSDAEGSRTSSVRIRRRVASSRLSRLTGKFVLPPPPDAAPARPPGVESPPAVAPDIQSALKPTSLGNWLNARLRLHRPASVGVSCAVAG